MSINRVPVFFNSRFTAVRLLENLMIVCSIALLLSWPFHHTIALRNSCLALGFCSSLIWLCLEKSTISLSLQNLTPCFLLFCLPLWLAVEYLFFPVSPAIQFAELSSLWLRVILAIPFAFVCGILINRHPFFLRLLIAVSCVYPGIPVAMNLYMQFSGGTWQPDPAYIFKTKVSGVYWLMWSCSLGLSLMHRLVLLNGDNQRLQEKIWPPFFFPRKKHPLNLHGF